jgi:hypothetical protein
VEILFFFIEINELIRWGEEDSNLRRLRQQIYSLPHLTALVSPRNFLFSGADGRTRTADRLITNQLLYQLSYIGLYARIIKNFEALLHKKTALFLKKDCKSRIVFLNTKTFF